MTREEVVAKARDLMTPVLGQATSANLIERVLGLEGIKDIERFGRYFKGPDRRCPS
jgi:hypothetical protein